MEIALRRLRAEDINQVIEIEKEAFSPLWLGTQFKRDLNNRYARYLVAYLVQETDSDSQSWSKNRIPEDSSLWNRMVKTVQGVVKREDNSPGPGSNLVGYVGLWFQGNEAHITEIAVREALRGKGIGELLLIGSVRASFEYGSAVVTLETRISNFVAQRLYEKYGFRTAGIRKGYYSDNRENAIIMTTSPIHAVEYRKRFSELQEAYQSRWREICIED
ncbi:MAG TPA: ribosomal protein S18-alanine N-acetyltransferase [Dehalococcoidia bacterium]|nr:ribosomal protein S18-alanine N-acetyltransferase [Dehalococcoidia bacterium]